MEEQSNLHQLQTLIISRATVTESEISTLLEETTALKTLHLGLAYRFTQRTALGDGWEIVDGLECITDTLEKLSLGVEYYPFTLGAYSTDIMLDAITRDDFWEFLTKGYPRLWSLEVPITMLLGFFPENAKEVTNVLPDTVHELCIQWDFYAVTCSRWCDEKDLFQVVRYILAGLESHTPHVKRITIRMLAWSTWLSSQHSSLSEVWAELQAECAQAGIELAAVFDELSPELWTQDFLCH